MKRLTTKLTLALMLGTVAGAAQADYGRPADDMIIGNDPATWSPSADIYAPHTDTLTRPTWRDRLNAHVENWKDQAHGWEMRRDLRACKRTALQAVKVVHHKLETLKSQLSDKDVERLQPAIDKIKEKKQDLIDAKKELVKAARHAGGVARHIIYKGHDINGQPVIENEQLKAKLHRVFLKTKHLLAYDKPNLAPEGADKVVAESEEKDAQELPVAPAMDNDDATDTDTDTDDEAAKADTDDTENDTDDDDDKSDSDVE